MAISDRIKYIRGGLTQKQFADKLGVSLGAVQHWEINNQVPKGDILVRFMEVFGVNINWLLTGDGERYLNSSTPKHRENSSVIKIVDLEHDDVIKKFNDKPRSKEANINLLRIESVNRDTFIEVVGYIKGVADSVVGSAKEQLGEQGPAATETQKTG